MFLLELTITVGKHKSLILEARKMNNNIILIGCPCHMAHNTVRKGEREFEKYVDFNVEQRLFLDAALPVLTSLNLVLQRADHVIHLMF